MKSSGAGEDRGDPAEETVVVVGHPVAGSTALDRFRFTVGGMATASLNLVARALIPTLPFICVVRQGPTNRIRVGLPRSESEARAQ